MHNLCWSSTFFAAPLPRHRHSCSRSGGPTPGTARLGEASQLTTQATREAASFLRPCERPLQYALPTRCSWRRASPLSVSKSRAFRPPQHRNIFIIVSAGLHCSRRLGTGQAVLALNGALRRGQLSSLRPKPSLSRDWSTTGSAMASVAVAPPAECPQPQPLASTSTWFLGGAQTVTPGVVLKSVDDKREYRLLTLPNGLRTMLIHDPEIRQAAGADDDEDDEEEDEEDGSESYEDDEDDDEGSWTESSGSSGDEDEEESESDESPKHGSKPAKKGDPVHKHKHGEECAACTKGDGADTDGGGSEDEDDGSEEGEAAPGAADMKATKKAAAAMTVNVGSFSDPEETQGLAHFLEHMLFMGSTKFPDENDYDAFLNKHGGGSNAFTETEHTCYHFDVSHKYLKPALDRFAQFFISPLVKAGSMEREVKAVDSEFNMSLQSDDCRMLQLQCSTSDPEHAFHKFSWGNHKSLTEPTEKGVDIRAKLLEMYEKHYCAGAMCLVVLGGEPLDVLEADVREIFAGVRPGGRDDRPSFWRDAPLWSGNDLYRLGSVKEQHLLHLTWPLPCLNAHYRKKPTDYISHIIGHEGTGSLLSVLKARGWATGLSAGVGDGGYDRSTAGYMFNVQISLTELGLAHVHEAVGLVYQGFALIRQEGPQEWVFQELQSMAGIEFRFQEEEEADTYAARLACNMLIYPGEHAIAGDYLFTEWDPQLVMETLKHFGPKNMRVDVQTSSFDKSAAGVQMEPWFQVPYTAEEVPAATFAEWEIPSKIDPALHMPPRNEFIPTDFAIRADAVTATGTGTGTGTGGEDGPAVVVAPAVPEAKPEAKTEAKPEAKVVEAGGKGEGGEENGGAAAAAAAKDESTALAMVAAAAAAAEPPVLILDSPQLRLWHKLDRSFRSPRAAACFALGSPAAYESARAAVLTELFVKLLEDTINETLYLANVAKLESTVSPSSWRLDVRLNGFNHKLPNLATFLFAQIQDFAVKADRFQVIREELARGFRNANMKPGKQATYWRLVVLRGTHWDVEERLAELLKLTPGDIAAFVPQLLKEVSMEALIHGNLDAEEAQALASGVRAALTAQPIAPSALPHERIHQLPLGEELLYELPAKNEAEENSVVEVYFQGMQDLGRASIRERAVLDLFERIVEEPYYNQLRTKEQLGYKVEASMRLTVGVFGFAFRVQSAAFAPPHIHSRIEDFISGIAALLEKMPRDEFEETRDALVSLKLQKDHSLMDEALRHWDQVWDRRYIFDTRQLEAAALAEVTKADVMAWYKEYLAPGAPNRRKFTVQVWGRSQWAKKQEVEAATPARKAVVTLIEKPEEYKEKLPLYPIVEIH